MAFQKKPNKNIIGQGAIVRSLRKPRPAPKAPPAAVEPDADEQMMMPMKKNC